MNCAAHIRYPYDPRVETLFAAEDKIFPRSAYTLAREGDDLVFACTASDSVALRAVLTAITKVLSVWETTQHHGRTRASDARGA